MTGSDRRFGGEGRGDGGVAVVRRCALGRFEVRGVSGPRVRVVDGADHFALTDTSTPAWAVVRGEVLALLGRP